MEKMRRITCLLLSLICILFLCSCGDTNTAEPDAGTEASSVPAPAPSTASEQPGGPDASGDPVMKLRWGSTLAAEDLVTQSLVRAAGLAYERSGGTIDITVYPASQLGDAVAQIEMCMTGSLDMFSETHSYLSSYGVPDAGCNEVLFLTRSLDDFARLVGSDLFKGWTDAFLAQTGIRTLSANHIRPAVQLACNTPVRAVADLKGMKIRTIQNISQLASVSALGASPTPIAYSEVYLSLQQGVVDGTLNTLDAMYTMGFYEVVDYMCILDCSYNTVCCWINDAVFQKMTEAQRRILTEVCNECGDWYREQMAEVVSQYVDLMSETTEVITYSEEEKAGFYDTAAGVMAGLEADGTFSQGLYAQLMEVFAG